MNQSLLFFMSEVLRQRVYIILKKVAIITDVLGKALLVTASDSGSG
ncbi:hypothetical protein [Nostoc sp. MG11]|nr:hypothetical protein [Nostoc sp. MG11]